LARLLDPSNPMAPLLDRATQGLYPTGSTFKPIVAEAGLATGFITPHAILPCTGSLTVGNIVFHNVEPAINADMNLDQALAISCDTWFYRLGTEFYARQAATGALDLQRWALGLGLGHTTGFDVPGEAGGAVPTPRCGDGRFPIRLNGSGTRATLSTRPSVKGTSPSHRSNSPPPTP